MTTIEERLRDLGRTITPPPLPGATAVMQQGRRRRHRRRGGVAALFVATGTGTAFAGNALLTDDGPSVRTVPAGVADDGPGGWEEVPGDGPPDGGSGGWQEVPGDDAADGSPGTWQEVPSDGPPDEAGEAGEWDQVPAEPPTRTSPTWTTAPSAPGDLVVPDVIGLDVDQARMVMEDLGFRVTIVGNGNDDALVGAQEPAAAAVAAVGAEIRLHVG
jgi:hypothetical protein